MPIKALLSLGFAAMSAAHGNKYPLSLAVSGKRLLVSFLKQTKGHVYWTCGTVTVWHCLPYT